MTTELSGNGNRWKQELEAELRKIIVQQSAKEVASKSIGRFGLAYITAMVIIGVIASYVLQGGAITAVIGMLSAALMALIQMLSGITGVSEKPDRPEFDVIKILIDKIDRLADREPAPMAVEVDEGRVSVRKGEDRIIATREDKRLPE